MLKSGQVWPHAVNGMTGAGSFGTEPRRGEHTSLKARSLRGLPKGVEMVKIGGPAVRSANRGLATGIHQRWIGPMLALDTAKRCRQEVTALADAYGIEDRSTLDRRRAAKQRRRWKRKAKSRRRSEAAKHGRCRTLSKAEIARLQASGVI